MITFFQRIWTKFKFRQLFGSLRVRSKDKAFAEYIASHILQAQAYPPAARCGYLLAISEMVGIAEYRHEASPSTIGYAREVLCLVVDKAFQEAASAEPRPEVVFDASRQN